MMGALRQKTENGKRLLDVRYKHGCENVILEPRLNVLFPPESVAPEKASKPLITIATTATVPQSPPPPPHHHHQRNQHQ